MKNKLMIIFGVLIIILFIILPFFYIEVQTRNMIKEAYWKSCHIYNIEMNEVYTTKANVSSDILPYMRIEYIPCTGKLQWFIYEYINVTKIHPNGTTSIIKKQRPQISSLNVRKLIGIIAEDVLNQYND